MSSIPPADPATTATPEHVHWLFGYGSLIWRPDFGYQQRCPARLAGWSRRFWQSSHDHRGVPEAPGRVVTLIADAPSHCIGMAYALAPEAYAQVVEQLDVRERNGYARVFVDIDLLRDAAPAADAPHGSTAPRTVRASIYIATPDNPAFAGDTPLPALARTIHSAHGPSGSNRAYLFELADALRGLHGLTGVDGAAQDAHVFDLEDAVRVLLQASAAEHS